MDEVKEKPSYSEKWLDRVTVQYRKFYIIRYEGSEVWSLNVVLTGGPAFLGSFSSLKDAKVGADELAIQNGVDGVWD